MTDKLGAEEVAQAFLAEGNGFYRLEDRKRVTEDVRRLATAYLALESDLAASETAREDTLLVFALVLSSCGGSVFVSDKIIREQSKNFEVAALPVVGGYRYSLTSTEEVAA